MDPVERSSKNGSRVRIRPARVADAPSTLAMHRDVVAAGDGMVVAPADLDEMGETTAVETLRKRAGELTAERGAFLVAEWVDVDQILGNAYVWRMVPSLTRHVALMAVEVRPSVQGLGIGRLLCERAIDWASEGGGRATPAVERLELCVRADNARARRLYESLQFEIEGVRRRYVRLGDGRYVDDLLMVRWLEPARPT